MSDRLAAPWRPTSAWDALVAGEREGRGEPGVRLQRLDIAHLTTIIVRPGLRAQFEQLVQEYFGCDAPGDGKIGFGHFGDLLWLAPGQWLVVGEIHLPTVFASVAAVTDQSDSRALVRISGPDARDALAKGVAIDLHPSVFATGSTATTRVAQMSVQIWQVDDMPTFVVAVPRSFSASFWSWLASACAEFTYEINEIE